MSEQELYKKYRPSTLDAVMGQPAAVKSLKGFIAADAMPHALLFCGPPGCLSGETQIYYKRGKRNSGRMLPLSELYKKSKGIPTSTVPWKNLDTVPTYLHSYDYATNRIVYNEIVDIIDSGGKECFRLTFDDGQILEATNEHPILTLRGFVEVQDLSMEDVVISRSSMLPTPQGRKPRSDRVVVYGLKYYRSGFRNNVEEPTTGKVYEYKRQHKARLIIEAALNGLEYSEYVRKLKSDPSAMELLCLPDGVDVHHINENSMDDAMDNLEVLSKADHTRKHDPVSRFCCDYTKEIKLVSKESVGIKHTYDIQMKSPNNNFCIGSGVVVHNTGKTTLARIVAREIGCKPLDLAELNFADSRGIEVVRELQEQTRFKPMSGGARAVIIDEAHAATPAAFQAMLKLLEDVPPFTYYLLCTSNPDKLPKAIQTRLTKISLSSLSAQQLVALIGEVSNAEGFTVSAADAGAIAKAANGSARTALVSLDQYRHSGFDKATLATITEQESIPEPIFNLCREIMNSGSWSKIHALASDLEDEKIEGIRHMIINYAASCMKTPAQCPKAVAVIRCFREPFFDSKKPGFLAACYVAATTK